jgi:D-alanyl-D-alanine dipeptidase
MLNEKPRGTFYSRPGFADFPESEYERRVSQARHSMAEKRVDALVLWDEHNIRYFCGFHSQHWGAKSIQPAVLVLPLEHDPVLIVPEFFRGMAEATSYVADIRGQDRPHHIASLRALPREVAKIVTNLGGGKKRIGLEDGAVAGMYIPRSISDIDLFRAELPGVTFVPAAEIIWECRTIKSGHEIEALKTACALTAEGFSEFVENFHLGMSEREAGTLLYTAIIKRGLQMGGMYFVGDPSRYPMIDSYPSFEGVPISRGSHLVIECGGAHKGYHGSVGRCLEIGPITEQKWEFIHAVEYGQDAALSALRDGVAAQDIIAAAAAALAEKGFKPTGFVGHGIGLTGHEPPDLTDAQTMPIRKGMVLAIEVWIYDVKGITRGGRLNAAPGAGCTNLGQFGMEEVVVVTENGYEMLPTFPREIRCIPRG